MNPKDDDAPATKKDIYLLMESIGEHYERTKQDMHELETRVFRYVDIKIENLLYDLKGASDDEVNANKDKIENHERRLNVVEMKLDIS